MNPNDPLRGVNYGGGHLPSWWLAGTERYNYLAYEQSFLPAAGEGAGPRDNWSTFNNYIEFDPIDGREVAYMATQTHDPWRSFNGVVSYAPLVVPKPGRTPPIRDDGYPGGTSDTPRLTPFSRAEWTSWHTIS